MTIFETPRLIVRPFTMSDEEPFFRLNSEDAVIRYVRPPKNREESHSFLLENLALYEQMPGYGRWAMLVKETGIMAGTFAIFPLDNTAEIQLGYALFPEFQGQGFATESTLAAIDYAFFQLNLPFIVAVTDAINTSSQKVLLRAGFQEYQTYKRGGILLKKFIRNRNT